MPFAIIVALLCVLVPLTLAAGGDEGSSEPAPTGTPIATIAKRVETLRGLRFKTLPKPVDVTPEQATREGLEGLDRDYPPARRAADEALYETLGLLEPGTDLKQVSESIFSSQVSGYYDPRDGRLRIVTGPSTGNRVLSEITIAHELDHALEDQAIGFDDEVLNDSDDAAYAYKALVEGTATALMYTYLERHFPRDVAIGGVLSGGLTASTGGLPPFILATLVFPYESGQRFVDALYRRGGNSWKLVDEAQRERPPVSTEQVLHPEKWLDREAPDRVTLPEAPAGYDELTAGTFGELQTQLWLGTRGDGREAAAGWGGDRYALYGRGDERLLLMRWTWDTAQDAEEFVDALEATLDGLDATADYGVDRGTVTVAFAEDFSLAQRLAGPDRG